MSATPCVSHAPWGFQFPNGFSQEEKDTKANEEASNFQFPNGFSQQYLPGMNLTTLLSIP